MIRNLLLLLVLAALSVGYSYGSNSVGESRPNIVFILADDMGYGDVSYLDHNSKINTTHLDALAREGVVFKDAHASSSVCTPTRYGVLTGRYNWRSRLKNGVLNGYSGPLIDADRMTMASMLKTKGYTTAFIGKWHLGWNWALKSGTEAKFDTETNTDNVDYSKKVTQGPTTRGFDYSFGVNASIDTPPFVFIENDVPTCSSPVVVPENDTKYKVRRGVYGSDFCFDDVLPTLITKADNFIKQSARAGDPFFLYLPITAPHAPLVPTDEFKGKSSVGVYGDFVLMVDAMVGQLMETLKTEGVADNTIFVFTSDNGCSPAADIPGLIAQGHYPNSIYRGHKADLFDGGHRVPCIVRWTEEFAPHEVEQTICLTDFYATFADIVGYDLSDSEGEDSYNILAALTSKDEVATIREATVHHSINGEFTIRQGDWKLLMSGGSGGWSEPKPANKALLATLPSMQLYNLRLDPSETNNLEAEYPEIVLHLATLLTQYIEAGRSTPGAPQSNDGDYPWAQLYWMD